MANMKNILLFNYNDLLLRLPHVGIIQNVTLANNQVQSLGLSYISYVSVMVVKLNIIQCQFLNNTGTADFPINL